jgi:hypothetical protein
MVSEMKPDNNGSQQGSQKIYNHGSQKSGTDSDM